MEHEDNDYIPEIAVWCTKKSHYLLLFIGMYGRKLYPQNDIWIKLGERHHSTKEDLIIDLNSTDTYYDYYEENV